MRIDALRVLRLVSGRGSARCVAGSIPPPPPGDRSELTVLDLDLILASSSPRRIELLERLELDFGTEPADVDESVISGESPHDYVARLAMAKGLSSARAGTVVIAADTAVVVDGLILGKPNDLDDSARMLRLLSGRSHEVVSGVAVIVSRPEEPQRSASAIATTTVRFAEMTEDRISWYVKTGEPTDKAGSYGLQGAAALFADEIGGSSTNVIGLPMPLLDSLFGELGLDLLDFKRPV